MHASTILSAVSCIAQVFGGKPSELLHLATSGQDTQELVPGQTDGALNQDPMFHSRADFYVHTLQHNPGQTEGAPDEDLELQPQDQADFYFHTLEHNNSYYQQTKCVWAANHTKQYCVFADTQFDQSKGIAFVTTPQRAQRIFEASASATARTHASTREPLFRTVDGIEGKGRDGKGRGLFANGYISAGTLLTIESPIILMDENLYEDIPSNTTQTALLKFAVEKLPTTTTQTFQQLLGWGMPNADSLVRKMWTNSYQLVGKPGKDWPRVGNESDINMMAVHANISKINHGCRPNAAAQWDWKLLGHRMYALRDILPDEELTMAYFDARQTLQDRQEYFTETLNFQCGCSHCKAEKKTKELSEDRVNEILLLESHLEGNVAPADPTAMAELLVSLYEQESLHLHISKAYALAALEYNGIGDEYKARSWAYKSVEASLIVGETADIDKYVEDMEDLLDGARIHWSWRYRVR